MRSFKRQSVLATVVAAALSAAPSLAATNLGFEDELSGWTTNGNDPTFAGVAGAAAVVDYYGGMTDVPTYLPKAGAYLGVVEAGLGRDVYTTLSQTFTLSAGGTIGGWAGFKANDGYALGGVGPFNDDGYLAVNGTHLLDWNVLSVGDFGWSGWDHFLFTALGAGTYTLELGVANRGDNDFNSASLLDAVQVNVAPSVPEAATWALMVLGFGLAGLSLRSGRHVVHFG